jgi:hypothetical protein
MFDFVPERSRSFLPSVRLFFQAFDFPPKLTNFLPKRSTSPVERSMIVLMNVLKDFEPFVRPYVLFKDIETQGLIFVSFHTPEP